jgi:hypothetical protein
MGSVHVLIGDGPWNFSDVPRAMLYFVAAWAILLGAILIALAFKARKLGGKISEAMSENPR